MADGQGFTNVTNGISNIIRSLVGDNGAADELGLLGKNGQSFGVAPVPPPAPARNNTIFIIVGIVGILVLIYLLKK